MCYLLISIFYWFIGLITFKDEGPFAGEHFEHRQPQLCIHRAVPGESEAGRVKGWHETSGTGGEKKNSQNWVQPRVTVTANQREVFRVPGRKPVVKDAREDEGERCGRPRDHKKHRDADELFQDLRLTVGRRSQPCLTHYGRNFKVDFRVPEDHQ